MMTGEENINELDVYNRGNFENKKAISVYKHYGFLPVDYKLYNNLKKYLLYNLNLLDHNFHYIN